MIRTPHGKANSKVSGTTLTIPGVTVEQCSALVVGIACENAHLAPDAVTHAGRSLRRKAQRNNATQGYHTSAWLKSEYHREQTGDIVATWADAVLERAMIASSYDLAQKKLDSAGQAETSPTTAPQTAPTGALSVADAFAVAFFGCNGPAEDHGSATADIKDGGAWTAATIGQQEGTTGGGAATNVTIVETYLQLTSGTATEGRLQSATSRRWSNVLLVLGERPQRHRQGLTPTDFGAVGDLVILAGGNVDDVTYAFDEDSGLWTATEPITGLMTRDEGGVWT